MHIHAEERIYSKVAIFQCPWFEKFWDMHESICDDHRSISFGKKLRARTCFRKSSTQNFLATVYLLCFQGHNRNPQCSAVVIVFKKFLSFWCIQAGHKQLIHRPVLLIHFFQYDNSNRYVRAKTTVNKVNKLGRCDLCHMHSICQGQPVLIPFQLCQSVPDLCP